MAQGLPVFEWFLHVLYLLVPPQWTVSIQRLHLSINIHRSKPEIKPEWYSQERKQHLLLEFIMNLKHFLSHNTHACQTKFKGLENYQYCFYMPVFKTGRIMVYQYPTVRPFHMSRSNLRTPWTIHFKFHRVIGIDGLTVCLLYGEISNFHSRVVGLYSSNCRRFFVCRAVNWEPLGQFTSNFA